MSRSLRFAACATIALALGGCDGSPAGPGSRDGNVSFTLARSDAEPATTAGSTAFAGAVSLEQVQSIEVTLTRVEALRHDGEEATWVSIDLNPAVTLDLMALPTGEENPLVLATAELEAGTYANVRLYVEDATVTFTEAVSIGGGPVATTYEANTAHPLRIAGPSDTRILVPTASFTVDGEASTEIGIVFFAGTSVKTIVATPLFLLMTPVLVAEVDDEDDA